MKRTCIIANKSAGHASAFNTRLESLPKKFNCEIGSKQSDESVEEMARRIAENGFDRIVVAGGDGTLNHVVNGIANHLDRIELGIIPLGTGNDFARSLELPIDQLDSAISIAFSDCVQPVDLIKVTNGNSFYAVNAASGGMAGKVASDVMTIDKQRWGAFAYWMTAFSELMDLQKTALHLDTDKDDFDLDVYGVVIANGRFVGGGFPISPKSTLCDGKLTAVIIPVLPTLELLSAGLNYSLGRSEVPEGIKAIETTRVHITSQPEMQFSIDGEPTCKIDATFEIVPKVLRVAVGEPTKDV